MNGYLTYTYLLFTYCLVTYTYTVLLSFFFFRLSKFWKICFQDDSIISRSSTKIDI